MGMTPGRGPGDQREHRSVTLGDLAALVVGVAVVLVLPTRQSYWPYRVDFLGPWPKWLPWCFCLRQALGAACLVLVPVVLRRRAAYGGLARPAEFLALFAAMPFLADSIETALLRLSYHLQTGIRLPGRGTDGMSSQFYLGWQAGPHQAFERALLLVGAVSLAACFLGRRKLPGWLLAALLSVAWLGAYESGPRLASRWAGSFVFRVTGRTIRATAGVLISAVFFHGPRSVLYAAPAIAAIRDVFHRDGRARPTWLEWASLGLAAALFLVAEPTERIREYSVMGVNESWTVETLVRAATILAAILVGFSLNRLAGATAGRSEGDPRPI